MRTFHIDFEFKEGLRKYDDLPVNSTGLITCMGLRPTDRGLVPTVKAANPFSDQSVSWPFPQLIKGKKELFLVFENTIYTVNETTMVATLLTTYEMASGTAIPATKGIASGGGLWHIADFGDNWMLFNGDNCIFNIMRPYSPDPPPSPTARILTMLPTVIDEVGIASGCDFRGRLVTGGFSGINWQSFFTDSWLGSVPAGDVTDGLPTDMPLGTNFVMWSSIGGGDVLYPFFTSLAESGVVSDSFHGATRPIWFDYIRRNDWGFMPMPWKGIVHCLKSMKRGVVVFGDAGVSALIPVAEPIATFGLVEILTGVGIANRSAVAGNQNNLVFVDKEGCLWHIDSDFTVGRLGYKEFFKDLIEYDLVGTYNQAENEFYFCTDKVGYVLTEGGLGQINQLFTSGQVIDGEFAGIKIDVGVSEIEFTSDAFNFGVRGIKHIPMVELTCQYDKPIQIAIDYRYDTKDRFVRSEWLTLHEEAVCYPCISGTDFRLAIRSNSMQNLRLSKARIWWQSVDGRFRIGI